MRTIREWLQEQGYASLPREWYEKIDAWLRWYRGKTPFHTYYQYNGQKKIKRVRKTMQMAKRVCEDRADLLLNERVHINMDSRQNQEAFDAILEENNFPVKGNQLVELSNATGTGAFVEYIAGGKVKIDYIQGDMIYPLSWENGVITECAFSSEKVIRGKPFVYLNMHTKDEAGNYVIINKVFERKGDQIREAELPDGVLPSFDTNSATPLFQIITPNVVNNSDRTNAVTANPMGIARFANAIDTLEFIDVIFDSFHGEFRLGKKRIVVSSRGAKIDMDSGKPLPIFDDNDTEFYSMDIDENIIKEINMALRADDHEKALNLALNVLSIQCGFGAGYYSYDHKTGVKTATEVVSDQSVLFRNKKKDDIVIESALRGLASAIIELNNTFTDATAIAIKKGISIDLDDSIIEDKAATRQNALIEFNAGVIDEVEYLMETRKWTEKQATDFIKRRDKRSPKPVTQDFFGGGSE